MIPLIIACDKPDMVIPLIDNDGNKFDTVNIGAQSWMQQNLNSAHYRNGDPIPEIKDGALWSSLTSGAWCWYNNDSVAYAAVYGKLYNWYAVNDPRGLAPVGWHVPGDEEWTKLRMQLGLNAGGKMKETGTMHWASPNSGATNSTGFTGLPGGSRYYFGSFQGIGNSGRWWSATEDSELFSWIGDLEHTSSDLGRHHYYKYFGFSVRCMRD
jgi:uncharacterized protein (TIGR02145 family)